MPTKLLIAVPNYTERVSGLFLDAMIGLTAHLARRFAPGEIQYSRSGMIYIEMTRNAAWDRARAQQAEALLCIDDDMTFTPATFDALWSTPGDVVSALYFKRKKPPTAPCMYYRMKNGKHAAVMTYPPGAVIEVDAVGFGFVLIRKPVLDVLESPFTRTMDAGEDIAFCVTAKAAGFAIRVNTGARAGHILNEPLVLDESNAGPPFGGS